MMHLDLVEALHWLGTASLGASVLLKLLPGTDDISWKPYAVFLKVLHNVIALNSDPPRLPGEERRER